MEKEAEVANNMFIGIELSMEAIDIFYKKNVGPSSTETNDSGTYEGDVIDVYKRQMLRLMNLGSSGLPERN